MKNNPKLSLQMGLETELCDTNSSKISKQQINIKSDSWFVVNLEPLTGAKTRAQKHRFTPKTQELPTRQKISLQ